MKLSFAREACQTFALAFSIAMMSQSSLSAAEPAATEPEKSAADKTPEPPPPAPKKKGWETTASAGATLTRGNSDTLLLTIGVDSLRKWEKSEASVGIAGGYGENNKLRNMEYVRGHGDVHELFTDRFYGGLHLDGTYDGIANLDYRGTFSPMVGYYLVKNHKTSLNVEGGPALVFERYSHQAQEGYWAARLGERFEHKISSTTKLWQSTDYLARLDQWSDKFVINFEIGIDTAITKKWSLQTRFQDSYDSAPAASHKHNDMRLIAGTAYKF